MYFHVMYFVKSNSNVMIYPMSPVSPSFMNPSVCVTAINNPDDNTNDTLYLCSALKRFHMVNMSLQFKEL